MKIEIAGWESEGLRCPDLKVSLLENGVPARVTLIQMPNGMGKTTTLDMLKATLDGSAVNWLPEDILAFRRPGETCERGRFRVDLLADSKPVAFELSLDFSEGLVQYRTTTPLVGGLITKWDPPASIRRFLSTEFIRLFIFDGEFADRLLDSEMAEAERAIDALCQLYLVDEIAEIAREAWDQAAKRSGPTTSQGLTVWQNRLKKYSARVSKLKLSLVAARKELVGVEKKLGSVQTKISTHISQETNLRVQHEAAVEELGAARARHGGALEEFMKRARRPNALHPAFANQLVNLKLHLDRLKLPETSSRQFFVELSEADDCICGIPLNDVTRAAIVARSEMYLGQEEAGSINALKKDIEDLSKGEAPESASSGLALAGEALSTAVRDVKLADQTVRLLKKSLIESGDDVLAGLEAELATLRAQQESLLGAIGDVEEESTPGMDLDKTHCLKALTAAVEEAEEKIAKISQTMRLKEQTDIIVRAVERAKEIARQQIRSALKDECNERLLAILANDPLQIESIGASLVLRGQGRASVGQTLSVGYTFLMSLLNRGNNQFPLVVDSPCGSLDDGRRRAIGGLIPRLCKQFITFVIPPEKADFLPALESAMGGAGIKYITAFRRTASMERMRRGLPVSKTQESVSGTLVDDREYFLNFTAGESEG